MHLCRKETFIDLKEGRLPKDVLRAARLQLNINARRIDLSLAEVLDIYNRALDLGPELILQHHAGTLTAIDLFLQGLSSAERRRVHVLLDESRGTGLSPAAWAVPGHLAGVYVGHAGGIGPSNVDAVIRAVTTLGRPFWVDMESDVRTDNEFDVDKARQVLEAAALHI